MADAYGNKICDMHSHILPGMDDGCRSQEMALAMLRQASVQKVDAMVCTPHYYPKESINSFLMRRAEAIAKITAVVSCADFACPALFYGAEVAWYEGLLDQTELPDLCINGTRYLLLELPFRPWSRAQVDTVRTLRRHYGITTIIAHFERYLRFGNEPALDDLLDAGALIQMNGEALFGFKNAHKAKKLLKSGAISLLGSDTHNPDSRPQTLGAAYEKLAKWHLGDLAEDISTCSSQILGL